MGGLVLRAGSTLDPRFRGGERKKIGRRLATTPLIPAKAGIQSGRK